MNVAEIFTSIQGEGKYIGKPTTFIRLSGCNLRCIWCDTRDSLYGGEELSIQKIVDSVKEQNINLVCITGGEPMLQAEDLKDLIRKLNEIGCEIVLETNGTIYDKWIFENVECVSLDIKSPSSGMKSNIDLVKKLKDTDQVKIVIADDEDFDYAKETLKKTSIEVILQPVGGMNLRNIAERVVEEKIDVRVLPQLHKIIGVK